MSMHACSACTAFGTGIRGDGHGNAPVRVASEKENKIAATFGRNYSCRWEIGIFHCHCLPLFIFVPMTKSGQQRE